MEKVVLGEMGEVARAKVEKMSRIKGCIVSEDGAGYFSRDGSVLIDESPLGRGEKQHSIVDV